MGIFDYGSLITGFSSFSVVRAMCLQKNEKEKKSYVIIKERNAISLLTDWSYYTPLSKVMSRLVNPLTMN